MIGSTTGQSWWTRIALALAWRGDAKIARRLAGFAATEAGSALDMLKAAEICGDEKYRRLFFRHALDEARHADMFQGMAKSLASDAAQWGEYAQIHATRQNLLAQYGLVRFLAFVHVAETKAAQQFEQLRRRFANRPEIAELFAKVLRDEKFHVAYSRHLLDMLIAQGQGKEVRAALLKVRWAGAWQAWRRAGRRIGDVLSRGLLTLLYWVVVPPFALMQRLSERGESAGWHEPPAPPRTIDEARGQS